MLRFFLFPCVTLCTALLCGAEIHEKVLICGVCQNVESRLVKTKMIMESIGALFDDYRILIYENNSTDRTPEILASWTRANPKVWLKSENLSDEELADVIVNVYSNGSPFLTERIARARNIVLAEALSPAYADFPYLIWMDMDFVRFPNFEGFIDTFQSEQEWDAVFAYGVDPSNIYWDWYAFRDANFPIGPELLGMYWWHLNKYLTLTEQDPWYPVHSAFGGCGIYKKASIQDCYYSGLATTDLESLAKMLMQEKEHPQILNYLNLNASLEGIYPVEEAKPNLPCIVNPRMGIVLHSNPDALIWRMNTFVYQYPSVCEHVPFHASMIVRGHDKLYINPKLVFRYGD